MHFGKELAHILGHGMVKYMGKHIELIRIVYNEFEKYFYNGIIIIGGSHFYNKIGYVTDSNYKDIDLIINHDKKYDFILYDIKEFLNYNFNVVDFFIERYDDNLIGCVNVDFYGSIDLLRNDFKDNLPPI
jgi:hypothetical protein